MPNSTIVIETPRLILQHLTINDANELAKIYADPIVMKFYPSVWTYVQTKQQIERTIATYEKLGFGLWATIYKANNKFIGRCGLVPQLVDGQREIEIGYLLAQEYWNQGLATEAACASRDYGFEMGCDRLISVIDLANIASQKVALKTGLTYEKDATMWEKSLCVYTIHK